MSGRVFGGGVVGGKTLGAGREFQPVFVERGSISGGGDGEVGDLFAVRMQFHTRRFVVGFGGGGADLDPVLAFASRLEFRRDGAGAGEGVNAKQRGPGGAGRLEIVTATGLLERLGGIGGGQRCGGDSLGRGEILFDEQRRDGEDVADVVEAMADIVGWKIFGGSEFDTEQIANRIVVFDAVESADGDSARIERGGVVAIECKEHAFQMAHDVLAVARGQARSVGWRHRTGLDGGQDGFPGGSVGGKRRVIPVAAQIDFAFALLIAMTCKTVLFEQRANPVGECGWWRAAR